ncbi:MAG: octaprenyl diphosphate synthase [Gammaproteobacteria bacterium]|nr:octaprenyl diphosphate synthase [Gammaproteobacteria bacterium]
MRACRIAKQTRHRVDASLVISPWNWQDPVCSSRTPATRQDSYVNDQIDAPNIDDVRDLIATDMAAADAMLLRRLHSDIALIDQLGRYVIASGGKRLRPMLAILSARAAGYGGSRHVDVAVIVELIHTATLLHDDVVDDSDRRRGRATANRIWGNAASVLVGDFLYSRAFQMMVDVGNLRVLEVLANATNVIAEGEVLQLLNCHDPSISEQRYLETIRQKTAKLFEAAAELGVVLAGRDEAHELTMAAYGRHLGTAFQLVDDALDYSASTEALGKNIGDDLAEGKPTLPLLYSMWHGTPDIKQLVREAIEQGGRERIADITRAIESTGAIAYTLRVARQEAALATEALATIPGSRYRDALNALTVFAVERTS